MFQLTWFHIALGPLERCSGLIVLAHKAIDGLPQLSDGSKTGPLQGLAAQNAEPALHLVEPGGMRGGVVKVHVRVTSQPPLVLGLVGTQVVQNCNPLLSIAICRSRTYYPAVNPR